MPSPHHSSTLPRVACAALVGWLLVSGCAARRSLNSTRVPVRGLAAVVVFPADVPRALDALVRRDATFALAVSAHGRSSSPELDGLAAQIGPAVVSALSKDGVLRFTDLSARADIVNELAFRLGDLASHPAEFQGLIGADALVYVQAEAPTYTCTQLARNWKGNPGAESTLTFTVTVRIVVVASGETFVFVGRGHDSRGGHYSPETSCAPASELFGLALRNAVSEATRGWAPRREETSVEVYLVTSDDDAAVSDLLRDGFSALPTDRAALEQEASWTTSVALWQQAAERQPDGVGPNANLGAWRLARGEFDLAVAHFRKARDADADERDRWQSQIDRALAAQATARQRASAPAR